jgi:hypothetical protein
MATINFAIDNPLFALQQEPPSGSAPSPGTVTGGPGGSIANNTITNVNIVPGTITGGVGGNIGAGTVTGGPGGNIAAGTIDNTNLAPGAAAANINAGPAGAINSSQIAGGPFLPLAGGIMTGQIVQSLAPLVGNDLANKTYVDGVLSTPGSIPGTSIVNNSITSTQLAPGAAVGNLTPNSVPGTTIVNNSITNAQIAPGTITSTELAPGAAAGNLTPNSVPGASIVNNSITNAQIAPGTITSTEIAAGTITSGNIQDGTITGTDIAAGTVTNSNLAPGPASTIKGTNSLVAVDDFVIGTGLSLTAGAGPTLSVDASVLGKAGDTQFGVVQFNASGDLKDSGVNTGIAKIRQPAAGSTVTNGGFDNLGNFVSSTVGAIVGVAVPNGTPLTFKNIMLQMPTTAPRSLQIQFATGPGGYIAGSGQPIWDTGATDPPTPFVTPRFLYRNVTTSGFVSLSERVANEPNNLPPSTLVTPAWDNSTATAPSTTGEGFVEVYNIYVNDGVDDAFYRITSCFFIPNSYITVERMG